MYGTLASVSTLLTRVGLASPSARTRASAGPASQPVCGIVANKPWRYGGSQRGSGSEPSITSRSAFSSPNRYSSGPVTMCTGTSTQPAAIISSRAPDRLVTSRS